MAFRTLKPVPSRAIIERAIELAATGEFRLFTELENKLHSEGYPKGNPHLAGRGIRSHLRALGNEARAGVAADDWHDV